MTRLPCCVELVKSTTERFTTDACYWRHRLIDRQTDKQTDNELIDVRCVQCTALLTAALLVSVLLCLCTCLTSTASAPFVNIIIIIIIIIIAMDTEDTLTGCYD